MRYVITLFLCLTCGGIASPLLAQSSTDRGELLVMRGFQHFRSQPDSAIYYLQEALPFLEEAQNWSYYVSAYNGLFSSYFLKMDYDQAEHYAQLAVQQAEKHKEAAGVPLGRAYSNLGRFYREKGALDQALTQYRKALEVLQAQPSPNLNDLALVYGNMGVVFRRKGDFGEATRYYEKSLALLQEMYGKKHPRIASLYYTLGRSHEEAGEKEEALAHYRSVLPVLDEFETSQYYRNYVDCYHSLAQLYLELEKLDSARHFVQQALQLQEEVAPHAEQTSYEIMGNLYETEGKYDLALQSFERALMLRKKIFGDLGQHPSVAASHRRIGELFLRQGRYQEALPPLRQALAGLTDPNAITAGLPEPEAVHHPKEALPVLLAMARCQQEAQPEKALQACQLGGQLLQRLRKAHLSQDARLWWGKDTRPLYELGMGLCYQLHSRTGQQRYLQEAFLIAEQSKAMVLYNDLQAAHALNNTGLPDSLQQRENDLKVSMGFYREKIFQESQKGKQADSIKLRRWKSVLFEMEEKHRRLLSQLEQKYPAYHQVKYGETIPSLAEVQAGLSGPENALITYFLGDTSLYSLCLGQQQLRFQRHEWDQDVQRQWNELLQELREPRFDMRGLQQYSQAAHALYEVLLASHLESFAPQQLLIIPDGMLSYLPFDLLLTQAPQLPTTNSSRSISQAYRNLPYLLKDYEVNYTFSATLNHLDLISQKRTATENLLAFAPQYEGGLSLVYNQQEALQVSAQVGGNSQVDVQATEASFKQLAPHYDLLHLVMHSQPNVSDPLYGYLHFSEEAGEDGRLHAHELYNLQLNARLVTLSACETGFGKLAEGEGVMNLARAFRYAGAPSIVSSLWKADGRASTDIMTSLYPQLQAGERIGAALRGAKLRFLKEATPDLVHPHFWGTFILIGKNNTLFSSWAGAAYWLMGAILLLGGVWAIGRWRKA
jgi:CHAT domain-containing protein/tetratricopeptide (TPR) repeat protein